MVRKSVVALSASAVFAAFGVGAGISAVHNQVVPERVAPTYTGTLTTTPAPSPSDSPSEAAVAPVAPVPTGSVSASPEPVGTVQERPRGTKYDESYYMPPLVNFAKQHCIPFDIGPEQCLAMAREYDANHYNGYPIELSHHIIDTVCVPQGLSVEMCTKLSEDYAVSMQRKAAEK